MRNIVLVPLVALLALSLIPNATASPAARVLIYGFTGPEDYPRLYELLENNGFVVDFLSYEDVDISVLTTVIDDYDVIVVPDLPCATLPRDVVEAVADFVDRGGGVLFLEYPFEGGTCFAQAFSVTCVPEGLTTQEEYLSFNVTGVLKYMANMSALPYAYTLVIRGDHVNPALIPRGTTSVPEELRGYNVTVLALAEVGRGRVAFLSAFSLLENKVVFLADNEQLIVNLFNWLAGRQLSPVNVEFQVARTQRVLAVGVFLLLAAALVVAFSGRIPLTGAKLFKAVTATIAVIMLAAAAYSAYGVSRMLEAYGPVWHEALSLYANPIATIAVLAIVLVLLRKAARPSELTDSALRLVLGHAASGLLVALAAAYLWLEVYASPLAFPLALTIYSLFAMRWLGFPSLWLLFRDKYEEKVLAPFTLSVGVPMERLRGILYRELYTRFIYPLFALVSLSYILPAFTTIALTELWGEIGGVEGWLNLFLINTFLVLALLISLLLVRKGPSRGFRDKQSLSALNAVVFTREIPYLVLTLYLVPYVAKSLVDVITGAGADLLDITYMLAGLFVGYAVGYAVLWLYFAGLKGLVTAAATTLTLLGYHWLVENYLIKPMVATIEQRLTVSAVFAVAVSSTLKRILGDFLKTLPSKPAPPSREKELRELLRKLDEALIEGRISEELYRALKRKYEEELAELSKSRQREQT